MVLEQDKDIAPVLREAGLLAPLPPVEVTGGAEAGARGGNAGLGKDAAGAGTGTGTGAGAGKAPWWKIWARNKPEGDTSARHSGLGSDSGAPSAGSSARSRSSASVSSATELASATTGKGNANSGAGGAKIGAGHAESRAAFETTALFVRSLPASAPSATNAEKLEAYALYKQAKEGDAPASRSGTRDKPPSRHATTPPNHHITSHHVTSHHITSSLRHPATRPTSTLRSLTARAKYNAWVSKRGMSEKDAEVAYVSLIQQQTEKYKWRLEK